LATVLFVFFASSPVMAQAPAVFDKTYESAKSTELKSVRLQLSTKPGTTAIVELNEAESALARLHLEADSAEPQKQ
jgi:hypothetical protein